MLKAKIVPPWNKQISGQVTSQSANFHLKLLSQISEHVCLQILLQLFIKSVSKLEICPDVAPNPEEGLQK